MSLFTAQGRAGSVLWTRPSHHILHLASSGLVLMSYNQSTWHCGWSWTTLQMSFMLWTCWFEPGQVSVPQGLEWTRSRALSRGDHRVLKKIRVSGLDVTYLWPRGAWEIWRPQTQVGAGVLILNPSTRPDQGVKTPGLWNLLSQRYTSKSGWLSGLHFCHLRQG